MKVSRAELFASLPPEWPEDVMPEIQAHLGAHPSKVVVLDDDPTGTQTVYDIAVLTEWSEESLRAELQLPGPGFYLLTNSRAFPENEAVAMNHEIGLRLRKLSMEMNVAVRVLSRSDSTLRGHFPAEVNALGAALLHGGAAGPLPPILIAPYFEDGGRFTIGDVHYVAEGDELIPAGQTPFAQDASFGFRASNLREWVEEKTNGSVQAADVRSLELSGIREKGPDWVADQLRLPDGAVSVVNAACQRDLEVVVLGAMKAEVPGAKTIYRTAASFAAARLGLRKRPPMSAAELGAVR